MADIEATAREMGWRPKEEFRGDPERWVDAETFVNRGENFIPILRADLKRAREENAALKAQLDETKAAIEASKEAISELKKFHSEQTIRQVEAAKKQVMAQLKEARENGDVEAEFRLLEELDDIKKAKAEAPPPPPAAPPPPPAEKVDAETAAWIERNPWFNTSARKRGLVMGICEEIRNDPATKHLVGKAFYDKLDEMVAAEPALAPAAAPAPPPASKVDSGRPTGGGGGGAPRPRTYADLPADAKAACDMQGRKLVGTAFKTEAEWRQYYANEYFAGETL